MSFGQLTLRRFDSLQWQRRASALATHSAVSSFITSTLPLPTISCRNGSLNTCLRVTVAGVRAIEFGSRSNQPHVFQYDPAQGLWTTEALQRVQNLDASQPPLCIVVGCNPFRQKTSSTS